jgi:hypothetical protein
MNILIFKEMRSCRVVCRYKQFGDACYPHLGDNPWMVVTLAMKQHAPPDRSFFEVVSTIFRTGAAICTAVVVARSTSPNRPNCEFRVLLRSFAATAWKLAKTSPWTLARTDLTPSLWQRPLHFRPRPAVSDEIKNGCHPPTHRTPLTWHPVTFPISKNEIEAERTPVWYHWRDPGRFAECVCHWQKMTSRKRFKNGRWDRCLHAGGNYFEGDGGR